MNHRISIIIILPLFALLFSCGSGKITVTEGLDPFSPKPGTKDNYEPDDITETATFLNYNPNTGAFTSRAEGGILSGMAQKHTFHKKLDVDWYKFTTKRGQRTIIETFDVSNGISTILQLYHRDSVSNNLVKIWGSDTGVVENNAINYDLAENPSDLKTSEKPNDIGTTLNQRVWLKRSSLGVKSISLTSGGSSFTSAPTVSFSGGGGSGAAATAIVSGNSVVGLNLTSYGSGYTSAPTVTISGGGGSGATATAAINAEEEVTYYLKVTIPPFLYREGKDANYSIRARGSGEYILEVPTEVVATRDNFTDRVELTWKQSQGATSYRVVRGLATVEAVCADDKFPCKMVR